MKSTIKINGVPWWNMMVRGPGDIGSCKMCKPFDSKCDGKKWMSFEQGSYMICYTFFF